MRVVTKAGALLWVCLLLIGSVSFLQAQSKLLISEIVVTPTGGEFAEIYNPGADSVDLSDYYLTDATFQGGGTFYYQIVEGGGGGGGFGDFHARFPSGATIAPGEYQTVAMNGTDFVTEYGVQPTYELYDTDSTITDMLEAVAGSINGQGGFTNGDEVCILYYWDGASDLVVDVDYLLYNAGSPAANNESVSKTGVSIDGPDADTDSSTYLDEVADSLQISALNHGFGFSLHRIDYSEGTQDTTGGNGVGGRDETSENLDVTFTNNSIPSPNAAWKNPPAENNAVKLLISEFVVTPTEGEYIEIYNPGIDTVALDDVYLTDATFQTGGTFYYQIVEDGGGGGGFGDFHARFPEGASILPGEYQTIAMDGAAFDTTYGVSPTYELYDTDSTIADMREAVEGSINGQGGLTNGDEVIILYYWNGVNDLVVDLDYVLYNQNSPAANNESVDKTGVSIDGPDEDSSPTTYLPDTADSLQTSAPNHGFGFSVHRIDYSEGTQTTIDGNGVDGGDETSENLDVTFTSNSIPSPNAGWDVPRNEVAYTESFEGGNFPPVGWSTANPDGGTGWIQVADSTSPIPGWTGGTITVPEGGGNFVAFATWNTGGATSNDQYLISPQLLDVQAGDFFELYLRYWPNTFADNVDILLSTTDTDPASFDIAVANLQFPDDDTTETWIAYSYDLTDYVDAGSDVYVAVREFVADNYADGASISMDLFSTSAAVDTTVTTFGNPPLNVDAIVGDSQIELTWVEPIGLNEIAYDDGVSDQQIGFAATGESAVRFTPRSYPTTLLGIRTTWHDVAGALDNVEYSVWENTTGGDAAPASEVLANMPYTVTVRGDWSEVDVAADSLEFTEGDFYISWVQPDTINYGLGFDNNSGDAGRSWISFDDGVTWSKVSQFNLPYNFMIRAIVQEGTGANAKIVELAPGGVVIAEKSLDGTMVMRDRDNGMVVDQQDVADFGAEMRARAAARAENDRRGALENLTSVDKVTKYKKSAHLFAPQTFQEAGQRTGGTIQTRKDRGGYSVEALTGFNVYRSEDSLTYSIIATVDDSTFNYVDETAVNGVTYYYYLTSVYDEGESGPSNVVSATPSGTPPEAQLALNHTPGDLNAAIYNDGFIGTEGSGFTGSGVTWRGVNGLFSGGLIFGSSVQASVNGHVPSLGLNTDVVNVTSDFAAGFESTADFDQVTTAYLNDEGAVTPYDVQIIQRSYSNTGDDYVFIRYGFVNESGAELTDFYSGIFVDWDVDNFGTNVGGVETGYQLVYTRDLGDAYYGFASMDGLSGARATTDGATATARTDSYTFITTFDETAPDSGDVRTWGGTSIGNIAAGDTAWVTWAMVAGDDLAQIQANAAAANTRAFELGWIEDITVGIEDETLGLPTEFALDQNYPNPFNPTTTIEYALKTRVDVKLEIYNVLGQLVKTLVNENQAAGFKQAIWDGTNNFGQKAASGLYVYRIEAGDFVKSKKMIFLK